MDRHGFQQPFQTVHNPFKQEIFMKARRTLIAMSLTALAMFGSGAQAATDAAKQQIRTLISTSYDQPGRAVETAPIVVADRHAIADWVQGEKGGRALLRINQGRWEIVACGGEGFRDVKELQKAGLPIGTAKLLVTQLNQAEAKVSGQRLKQFDSFGKVEMATPSQHRGHAQ
ncbi:copper uptake system-associated protein [Rugamonas rubra]|jgi:hypothetical protein|nr:copper uptake system-associated protein [Rugamonas rubra]